MWSQQQNLNILKLLNTIYIDQCEAYNLYSTRVL